MPRLIHHPEDQHIILPLRPLNDDRLSFTARGILLYLHTGTKAHPVTIQEVYAHSGAHETVQITYDALQELVILGYVEADDIHSH